MIDLAIPNQTTDTASSEMCHVCDTPMVIRERISVPFKSGSPTFQAEWYHCPKCNRMRKMIEGAARVRDRYGIHSFKWELIKKARRK